jgi:hypothetical protein
MVQERRVSCAAYTMVRVGYGVVICSEFGVVICSKGFIHSRYHMVGCGMILCSKCAKYGMLESYAASATVLRDGALTSPHSSD